MVVDLCLEEQPPAPFGETSGRLLYFMEQQLIRFRVLTMLIPSFEDDIIESRHKGPEVLKPVLGLRGPLSSASKSGQWSVSDDERACKTWLLKVVSHSALQKNESSLQRVGFPFSLLQVNLQFCRWISLSS